MFFSYIFTYVCVCVRTQAYKASAAGQPRDFNMQGTLNTNVQDGGSKEGGGKGENVNTREADFPGIACARERELYVPE